MADILWEIRDAQGTNYYFYLGGVALILLLILWKGKRKSVIVPWILISAFILNPWFYSVWNKINAYAYWRTLWILPVIPACAAVPAFLVEKRKKVWLQAAAIAACTVIFVLAGSYIYKQSQRDFQVAANAEKLPQEAVEVGKALLELEDTPFVVADNALAIYLRQYSGKIQSMYARDVYWGGGSGQGRSVFENLTEPDGDLQEAAQVMLNYDYPYLVAKDSDEARKNALEQAGFALVRQVGNYSIYRVTGQRTELRAYNEHHQVTSVTYLNKAGEPDNNASGCAYIEYEYDKNGYICQELHRNLAGELVPDPSGKAGYRRVFDKRGLILKEEWVGADGNIVEVNGYAGRECTYNRDKKLTSERYFDADQNSVVRKDIQFAERKLFYDKEENLVGERYYGADGELVLASYGYAGYDRVYDQNKRIVKEAYVDTDEKPIAVDAGYCAFAREYDEAGNITVEYYLDEKGEKTNNKSGFACIRKEFNENGKVTREWYEDPEGNGVILSAGYAGIEREYDASDNVISEKYLDVDGNEAPRNTGYSRISRMYDAENRLTRESYFLGETPFTIPDGFASYYRFYDEEGNIREERYFDEDGQPAVTAKGYSVIRHSYDDKNRKLEDDFLDAAGNPAVIGPGYCKCQYTYTANGQISLIYYLDQNDQPIEAGSGYLHEYLQSLKGRNVSIFMAIKDEGSSQITETIHKDMMELGITTDLRGQYRKSFYAVVTPEGTKEELSKSQISCKGSIIGVPFVVSSAGFEVGNTCSIQIGSVEYAKNLRGLNIVLYDNEKKNVVESISFDTCAQEINVTR